MDTEDTIPAFSLALQQQATAALQSQQQLYHQAQAQSTGTPHQVPVPVASSSAAVGFLPTSLAAPAPLPTQPFGGQLGMPSQQSLATQLTLAGKLAKQPPKWQPSQQSWADYAPTLHAFFAAQAVGLNQRVWPALTYLPSATQQELYRQYPGLLEGPDGPLGTFSWLQLDHFCTTQQVAHMETDMDLHTQLDRQHQFNLAKHTTTPLATHLEHVETFFPRFSVPIADTTKVYFVYKSLHPAAKPLMHLDPTGAPWSSYTHFRAHLIASTPALNQAIAHWQPITRKRPFSGGSRPYPRAAPDPAAEDTRPLVRPRRSDTWTEEQKARAAQGLCAYCPERFTPGHRCQTQASAHGTGPSSITPPLLLTLHHPTSATSLFRGEETTINYTQTKDRGVEQQQEQHTASDVVSPEEEPTLDELIEAYVAFDTLWQHEKNQQADFILAAMDRARRDTRQRRKHKIPAQPQNPNPSKRVTRDVIPSASTDSHISSEDRRFIPSEFEKLKAKLPQISFTLDACANPDGSNAICGSFCSIVNSFLTKDLANQMIWLNPPYNRAREFLSHYQQQKLLHPEISAVIVLPKWRSLADHPLYRQLQLLYTYPKGYHLYDAAYRTSSSPTGSAVVAAAVVADEQAALVEPYSHTYSPTFTWCSLGGASLV